MMMIILSIHDIEGREYARACAYPYIDNNMSSSSSSSIGSDAASFRPIAIEPYKERAYRDYAESEIQSPSFVYDSSGMHVIRSSQNDGFFGWTSVWGDGPNIYVQSMVAFTAYSIKLCLSNGFGMNEVHAEIGRCGHIEMRRVQIIASLVHHLIAYLRAIGHPIPKIMLILASVVSKDM